MYVSIYTFECCVWMILLHFQSSGFSAADFDFENFSLNLRFYNFFGCFNIVVVRHEVWDSELDFSLWSTLNIVREKVGVLCLDLESSS